MDARLLHLKWCRTMSLSALCIENYTTVPSWNLKNTREYLYLKWRLLIQRIQIKKYMLKNMTPKLEHQKIDKHKMTRKNWSGGVCN